jgi:IS5 family transposase
LGDADAGTGRFFDVDERLKQLSAKGDSLERLSAVVDFELFRPGSRTRSATLGPRERRPPGL